jgi:hypothetical protein
MLPSDDEQAARRATTFVGDSRARQFWTPTPWVGEAFQGPLGLAAEPAWDVYLVYARGIRWEGDVPPKPSSFMHQLRGRLPGDRILNQSRLSEELRSQSAAN